MTVTFKPLFINEYLRLSCYSTFVTQTKETIMRQLIKLPIYLAIITLILACLCSTSHAWPIERVGVEGVIQDTERAQWVKEHTPGREYAGLSVHVQGKCVSNCARPIDGREDSIEISDARTSMPEEYITIPAKPTQHYSGR